MRRAGSGVLRGRPRSVSGRNSAGRGHVRRGGRRGGSRRFRRGCLVRRPESLRRQIGPHIGAGAQSAVKTQFQRDAGEGAAGVRRRPKRRRFPHVGRRFLRFRRQQGQPLRRQGQLVHTHERLYARQGLGQIAQQGKDFIHAPADMLHELTGRAHWLGRTVRQLGRTVDPASAQGKGLQIQHEAILPAQSPGQADLRQFQPAAGGILAAYRQPGLEGQAFQLLHGQAQAGGLQRGGQGGVDGLPQPVLTGRGAEPAQAARGKQEQRRKAEQQRAQQAAQPPGGLARRGQRGIGQGGRRGRAAGSVLLHQNDCPMLM